MNQNQICIGEVYLKEVEQCFRQLYEEDGEVSAEKKFYFESDLISIFCELDDFLEQKKFLLPAAVLIFIKYEFHKLSIRKSEQRFESVECCYCYIKQKLDRLLSTGN